MQSSCDVRLDLVNTLGAFQILRGSPGPQTEYTVFVQEPKSIGIASDEQSIINEASQDLVLACDVVLQSAAMSLFRIAISKPNVTFVSTPTPAIVKDIPNGKSIVISETIHVRDEVHVTVVTQELLDESRTVQLARQLSKLQRFNLDASSTPQRANLISALHEYEAVMASMDRLLVFKHLYNVLELVTNIDGVNREGFKLDTQMAAVSGGSQPECEAWRSLYNRTKHIHRDPSDIATFVTGVEKVTRHISIMRKASGAALANLLNRV
jgi:hypothetical protein